jgi:hypothetical protein
VNSELSELDVDQAQRHYPCYPCHPWFSSGTRRAAQAKIEESGFGVQGSGRSDQLPVISNRILWQIASAISSGSGVRGRPVYPPPRSLRWKLIRPICGVIRVIRAIRGSLPGHGGRRKHRPLHLFAISY